MYMHGTMWPVQNNYVFGIPDASFFLIVQLQSGYDDD